MKELLSALADRVGADIISTDADVLATHGRDWTRFFEPNASAILFPRTIEQVQQIVVFANENMMSLVPSGGRTGLSGGAVATNQEVVISFDRMNKILDFDAVDGAVTVQPGVITQQLQTFAEGKELFYPVDFASSGSSQIGGNIATNAGGIKVLRYGLTRDWISGLKVVTGTGELLDLNKGLIKNATGYDLRHLFIGSEGTLGLIVEATVQLTKPPKSLNVLLLAVNKMTDIISILQRFKQNIDLTAFEFFSELALQHVLEHTDLKHPFAEADNYYALLEFECDSESVLDEAMLAFEDCVEQGLASDGVLSQSEQNRRDLWRYREDISESITPHTPYKNDIAVRVSQVPALLDAVEKEVLAKYPDFDIVWFGHIGDGNLHLNILKPADLDVTVFKKECEQVSQGVLAVVQQFEGSISAEHGVGLLKKNQLHFTRSAAEIALMKSIKASFDPNNIMNPGKVL